MSRPRARHRLLAALLLTFAASGVHAAETADDNPQNLPTVQLATLTWEPYIGESMPENGYVHALVKEAFRRGGYAAKISFLPWARALSESKSGTRDALFPEYYDESREADFVFSDPYPGGPVGLMKRKDKDIQWELDPRQHPTDALRPLAPYRIGVVRGYINTTEFDAADFLQKDAAVDDEMNIKKLYRDRVQLIFVDKYVAHHIMIRNYPWYVSELEFMEPPMEVKDLFVAISRKAPDYQAKLNAFNSGLRTMREDGTLNKILDQFGF